MSSALAVAVHSIWGEQWHRLILGRSFLRHYHVAYDGPSGEVTITAV